MSIRTAVCACLLVGCDTGGSASPARIFDADLVDAGPAQAELRSQPQRGDTWNGRAESLAYIEMVAPVVAQATISTAPSVDGASPNELVVFLDGGGELGDVGRRADGSGAFAESVLPSTYDALIAPDALLTDHPAMLLSSVTFDAATGTQAWTLDPRFEVPGAVRFTDGNGVSGATVTVFRGREPKLPLGVTVETDSTGAFAFDVPPDRYDLLVAGPPDAAFVLPTVRLLGVDLPLLPGVELTIEVERVPSITLHGALLRSLPAGTPVQGRVLVECVIEDLSPGVGPVPGRFRAEVETSSDGSFDVSVPPGRVTVRGIPRFSNPPVPGADPPRGLGQSLGVGRLELAVSSDATSVDDIVVTMPDSPPVRLEAMQPNGRPLQGAAFQIRMRGAPRYAYRQAADEDGAWIGFLMPAVYDVEVLPPAAEGEPATYARAQGVLDLTAGEDILSLTVPRSDTMQGMVYTVGRQGAGDVQVLLRDPVDSSLWGSAVTRQSGDFRGVFEIAVPRP